MWGHLPKMGVVVGRLGRREDTGVTLLNLRSH